MDATTRMLTDSISEMVVRDLFDNYDDGGKRYLERTFEGICDLKEELRSIDERLDAGSIDRPMACRLLNPSCVRLRNVIKSETMTAAFVFVMLGNVPEAVPDGLYSISAKVATDAVYNIMALHLLALRSDWDNLQWAKTTCSVGLDVLEPIVSRMERIFRGEDET